MSGLCTCCLYSLTSNLYITICAITKRDVVVVITIFTGLFCMVIRVEFMVFRLYHCNTISGDIYGVIPEGSAQMFCHVDEVSENTEP